jgi:hypothetical protein
LTEETLLRKNSQYVKLAIVVALLMNQHLVQITVCISPEVYEYAQAKNERDGQTIDQQIQKALELLQTVEMLMNGVKTSGF